MKKLTAKQKNFCEEYAKDSNGTQAAIRAGYSKNSAKETAYEILTYPHISKYLKELQDKVTKRNEVTVDEIVKDLRSFMNNEDFTGSARVAAAVALGKSIGMFTDKVETTLMAEPVDLSELSDEQLDQLEELLVKKH